MASIYQIASGMWYAPRWENPRTGEVVPAHSLGTKDEGEAETRWCLERARSLEPLRGLVAAAERPAGGGQLLLTESETFEVAVRAYVARKSRVWKKATRERWAAEIATILTRQFHHGGRPVTLGSRRVLEFAGDLGAELLQSWVDAEIARAKGRTHTVVKRIANLIKPALGLAWQKGWAGGAQFPIFPELKSDYQAEGARDFALTSAEFIAVLGELAEHDAIRSYERKREGVPLAEVAARAGVSVAAAWRALHGRIGRPSERYRGGRPTFVARRVRVEAAARELGYLTPGEPGRAGEIGVYPRLAAIIACRTGMHESDVYAFSTADWDEAGGRWYRRNSKGADHYPAEWFPAPALLTAALRNAKPRFEPHYCARWDGWDRTKSPPVCKACGRPADLWLYDGHPENAPGHWMRERLEAAGRRAGLSWTLVMTDFRHTFATWARDEGWRKDETAKWLANSSGMVERVYAQIANAHFVAHVEKASLREREMLEIVALLALGKRRGPRLANPQFQAPSKLHSERDENAEASAGYQTKRG